MSLNDTNEEPSKSKEGYIYVLWNQAFEQNVFKIGRAKDVKKRLEGYTTSFPTECEIKFQSEKLKDCYIVEKIVQLKLDSCRINKSREFFKMDIESIKNVIIETINNLQCINNCINTNSVYDLHTDTIPMEVECVDEKECKEEEIEDEVEEKEECIPSKEVGVINVRKFLKSMVKSTDKDKYDRVYIKDLYKYYKVWMLGRRYEYEYIERSISEESFNNIIEEEVEKTKKYKKRLKINTNKGYLVKREYKIF
jgi:hypothetical protein